ncbi:MAG: GspH/FimT family pseudopilin [Gemmatimonadetes bacterium]|nr:GspH/FimT family pseudopilin [Gemmatimonadota bacterium]
MGVGIVDASSRGIEGRRRPSRGFGSIELLIAIALIGLLLATTVSWEPIDRWSLARATRLAETELRRARSVALSEHRRIDVRADDGWLELSAPGSGPIGRIQLAGPGGLADSIRLRPRVLRFNGRGQGSAGSLFIYRGSRGMRVISNFLGRVRTIRFRL